MTIKKAYVKIAQLLEANKNKKVATILPELLELMTAKSGGQNNGKNFVKDADGNVVAVFCYYHKKWELTAEIEYGKKANTATGLNTMCKEGTSNWTKQNRQAKQAELALLDKLSSGEILPGDLQDEREDIEEAKQTIVPHSNQEASSTHLSDLVTEDLL